MNSASRFRGDPARSDATPGDTGVFAVRWMATLVLALALAAPTTGLWVEAAQPADNVAPVFVSARTDVTGKKVIVTFSEEITVSPFVRYVSEVYDTPLYQFMKAVMNVTVDGNEDVLADAASISGREVTFQLASGAAGSGQTVRVAYDNVFAVDSGGLFTDAAGNAVPYFSYQAVQNNSEVTDVVTPDAGPVLSHNRMTLAEGGSDMYTVRLASRPSGEIEVTLIAFPTSVSVRPTSMKFDQESWNDPQTATVSVEDDDDSLNAWGLLGHIATNLAWTYVRVVVADADPPLRVSGETSIDFIEKSAAPVADYSVDNAGSSTITWSLWGDDSGDFTISSDGVLTFKTPPDSENPADANRDNVYRVTIQASNGTSTGTLLDVRITVMDEEIRPPPPPPRPPPPPPLPPPPPPPPQQPVSPAVTGVSTMSVTVSWTAPTGDGPLIRNYDLRYREGSAGEWKDGPQDVRNTSATIDGLDPDTAYEVQVRSSSSSMNSEWSALITTRTLAPPPPPVSPAVTETTSGSVTVGWTAPPADAGLPVTGYDLRYRVGGEGDWMEGPQDVTGTSAIVAGLEPDTEYEVQVRSKSAAGNGEWTVLGTVRTEVLILYDLFSISLDLDPSEADQTTWMLNVTPGDVVPVQVFASDILGTRGMDLRVGYDTTQVVFAGFDVGDALPDVNALVKQDSTSVEIGISSLAGNAWVDSGRVGTVSFRTTDALTETEIRVAGVNVVRGEHPESMTRSVSILLQAGAPPSADFDGSGDVAFADFVLFAGVFGTGEGDGTYDARFDLSGDGGIRFDDFVIFAAHFGDTVNRAPVFDAASPVMLSVAGNTLAGEPIGEPVAATDADGNTLTYSLWGADAEHFAIDAGTGQILTKGTYDFERKKGYAVIVRAVDGKGGRTSLLVTIQVESGSQ